jgi:sensor histidine kinase YesM
MLGVFQGVLGQFLFFLTHHLIIFYSAYFALSKSSASDFKSVLRSILYILLSILVFFAAHYLWYGGIRRWFVEEFRPVGNIKMFIIHGFIWYIQFFLIAMGFYFADRSSRKERLSEKKRLQSESAFLRSQINPHFLQNTLNYFYAQALTGNTRELAESILLLSEIMRYSMESQDDSTHKVLLSRELDHLNNFIKINQLRFSKNLSIRFEQDVKSDAVMIIPLVIITMVENAFKHGDLNDAENPLIIRLSADEKPGGVLNFSVTNKIKNGPKEPSHGIGIDNTRRRLDASYGKDYSLTISKDDQNYTVALIIHLKAKDFKIPGHDDEYIRHKPDMKKSLPTSFL